jgi:hypothetical protein
MLVPLLCCNGCRLIGPPLLVQKCFGIEPRAVGRLVADVALQPGDDVSEDHPALAAGIKLCQRFWLSNLVRKERPEHFAVIIRPAVVRARF